MKHLHASVDTSARHPPWSERIPLWLRAFWPKLRPLVNLLILHMIVFTLYFHASARPFLNNACSALEPPYIAAILKQNARIWRTHPLHFGPQHFFYPYPNANFFANAFIGQSLFLAPLANRPVQQICVAAYAVGFISGAWGMSVLALGVTRSVLAAAIVSTVWAYNPVRIVWGLKTSHLWEWPFFLCALFLYRWLTQNRWRWFFGAWGLFMIGTTFNVLYFPVMFLVITVAVFTALSLVTQSSKWQLGWRAVVLLVCFAAGQWLMLIPYQKISTLFGLTPSLSPLLRYSLSIHDLWSYPSSLSLSPWIHRLGGPVSHRAPFPGIVFSTLFLWVWWTRFQRKEKLAILWVLLITCGLALGPKIQWTQNHVIATNGLWMKLIELYPTLMHFRTPFRFVIGLNWLLGGLLVLGFARLNLRTNSRRTWIIAATAALLVIMIHDTRIRPRNVPRANGHRHIYGWVPPNASLLELPIERTHRRFESIIAATERGFYTVLGQGAFLTPVYQWALRLGRRPMQSPDRRYLTALRINAILLHRHDYPNRRLYHQHRHFLQRMGYRPVVDTGNDVLLFKAFSRPMRALTDRFDLTLFDWHVISRDASLQLHAHVRGTYANLYPRFHHRFELVTPEGQKIAMVYTDPTLVVTNQTWTLPLKNGRTFPPYLVLSVPQRSQYLVLSIPQGR